MNRIALGLIGVAWLASSTAALAQECETDDDCPEWHACDHAPVAARDCAPQPCDAGIAEPEPGQCEPQKISCGSDADCPTGLVCAEEEESGSDCAAPAPGFDAGSFECEPPEVTIERSCAFDTTECERDDQCTQAGFSCQAVGQTRTVSCSSGGSSGGACAPDEQCPPAQEPVCEEEEGEAVRLCFPIRVDCTDDTDCADDWRCVELSEDAQDDAPMGWESATNVCMPEGLALALEERIDLGSSGASKSRSGIAASGSDEGGGASTTADSNEAAGDDGGESETSGGGSSSACAVDAMAPNATLPLALLTALALLRRRRR